MDAKEFLDKVANICGRCMDCFRCPLNSLCGDFRYMSSKKDELLKAVEENYDEKCTPIL